MNISLSVIAYNGQLEVLLNRLPDMDIDMLHVDCIDADKLAPLLTQIRSHTDLPIDLHLIDHRSDILAIAKEFRVDTVSFQYEQLNGNASLISDNAFGISIDEHTDITELPIDWNEIKFIQLMSGIPGVSGGAFNQINIDKLNWLKENHPDLEIHIDGGVNEVSLDSLKDYNISTIVSGSFIYNSPNWDDAIELIRSRTKSEV